MWFTRSSRLSASRGSHAPGVNDAIVTPWLIDWADPLRSYGEKDEPVTTESSFWIPESMSIVRVHLFHHPDYESNPRVAAGEKSPAGWYNGVKHGDLALIFDVTVDNEYPWMFLATVLINGQLLSIGGKWLMSLEKFEEDCDE